jgi:flagellar biosynthesis/type III secretory pathway ATPase
VVIGSAAAAVQVLGLVRWPFAAPALARRYVAAEAAEAPATRETIEVVFATLNRLLGVGIGEHLGYLLTGLWTVLVAISIVSTTVIARLRLIGRMCAGARSSVDQSS